MKISTHRVEPGTKVRMRDFDPDFTPLIDDKAKAKEKSLAMQERLG